MVPGVTVDDNTININGNNITLTLSWGEPFNNLDPIVNYTVSCSGDVTCPPNFTTTDSTTRSYTITNLTTITNYTFSVVATNSIGSGEAGVLNYTTPGKTSDDMYGSDNDMYICTYVLLIYLPVLKQIKEATREISCQLDDNYISPYPIAWFLGGITHHGGCL